MRAKRKGFTLIELIVAMVLAAMLLGALIPLLVTAQKSTYDAQKKTRAAQAGEAIYTYVADQLRSAERVFIGHGTTTPTEPPADQWNQITVGANGCLAINGVTPYPESYQEGAALTLTAQGHDRTALDLTVQLGDLYEKTSAITLQNLIRSGFSQTEGTVGKPLSTADDGDVLTIYYLGGDGTLPTFPTPGDTTPDASHPTPTEDKLTVTVLNKSLRVKPGEDAVIQAYIHVPASAAGAGANFVWSQSGGGYIVFNATTTPEKGVLSTSGIVTMSIKGNKATEGTPVTVTLKAALAPDDPLVGTTETKQDTCQVTVYEDNAEPNDEIQLIYKASTEGAGYGGDPNNSTQKHVYLNLENYKNGFSLTAFQGINGSKLKGTWEVTEETPAGSFGSIVQTNEAAGNMYISPNNLHTGTFTVKFTCSGFAQDGALVEKLKNQWTYTTITFFSKKEMVVDLKFVPSGMTAQTVYYNADTQKGDLAATASLTIKPTTDAMKEILPELLKEATVDLTTSAAGNPSVWGDWNPLLAKPAIQQLSAPQTDGSYTLSYFLNYERVPTAETETFPAIYGVVQCKDNTSFLTLPITLTVKEAPIKWPTPTITFNTGETQKTISCGENNVGTAIQYAVVTFDFKNATVAARALAEQQKVQLLYSDGAQTAAWPQDPLILEPLLSSNSELVYGDEKKETLVAKIPLIPGRLPKGESEAMSFKAALVSMPAIQSVDSITLTLEKMEDDLVLRLGNGEAAGRIVNSSTVVIGEQDKFYVTAFDEREGQTQIIGRWDATYYSTFFGLVTYNNWVSKMVTDTGKSYRVSDVYADEQDKGEPPNRTLDWWVLWKKTWDTVPITFTDNQRGTGGTNKKLDVSVKVVSVDHVQTNLELEGASTVTRGEAVSLKLQTQYVDGQKYSVKWKISNPQFFELPDPIDATGNGTLQTYPGSLTLTPKDVLPFDEPQEITVTAIWTAENGNVVIGEDSVTVTVTCPPLEVRQRVGTTWVPVTATVQTAVKEPVLLAVFRGEEQIMGTWVSSDTTILLPQPETAAYYSKGGTKAGTVTLTFREEETGKECAVEVNILPVGDIGGTELPTGNLETDGEDGDIAVPAEKQDLAEGVRLGYNKDLSGGTNNHTFTLYHQVAENNWVKLILPTGAQTVQVGNLEVSIDKGSTGNGIWLKFKQTGPVTEPVVEKFQLIAVKNGGKETRVSSVITVTLLPES